TLRSQKKLAQGRGHLIEIILAHIGDDKNPRLLAVVEGRGYLCSDDWTRKMEGTDPRLCYAPVRLGLAAAIRQGCRGNEYSMSTLQDGLSKRAGRVDPVPMQSDVHLASFDTVHRQPLDKVFRRLFAGDQGLEHGLPCPHWQQQSPFQRTDQAFDPPTLIAVEAFGFLIELACKQPRDFLARLEQLLELSVQCHGLLKKVR